MSTYLHSLQAVQLSFTYDVVVATPLIFHHNLLRFRVSVYGTTLLLMRHGLDARQ
jgi:hypothetical protein